MTTTKTSTMSNTYADICAAEIYELTCRLNGEYSYAPRHNDRDDENAVDAIATQKKVSRHEAELLFARRAKADHRSAIKGEIADWKRRRADWRSGVLVPA